MFSYDLGKNGTILIGKKPKKLARDAKLYTVQALFFGLRNKESHFFYKTSYAKNIFEYFGRLQFDYPQTTLIEQWKRKYLFLFYFEIFCLIQFF
jgi:hypothetical protein